MELLTLNVLTGFVNSVQGVASMHGNSYSNAIGNRDVTMRKMKVDTGIDGIYELAQDFYNTNWNVVRLHGDIYLQQ